MACSRRAVLIDLLLGGLNMARCWIAIALLAGWAGTWLGCTDLGAAPSREDASTGMQPEASVSSDGGDRGKRDAAVANGPGSGAGSGAGSGPGAGGSASAFFDAGFAQATGKVCTLAVGATCDGPEDCPDPQACCAVFDSLRFSYVRIGCSLTCEGPDHLELCHPQQGCRVPGAICRRSAIVPHDFITVCAGAAPVPSATTSESIDDVVVCGAERCRAADQQCCLRSQFDFGSLMSTPLEPYCAPSGSECSCDSTAPDPDFDAGALSE